MRIAVLVSGGGTNLQALLDAQAAGRLAPAEIAVVVSNRPKAAALDRVRGSDIDAIARIPAIVVDHELYEDRTSFEDAMLAELRARQVEAVVLAGFMRVLTGRFIAGYPGRIINTHPALLPAFPGVRAPAQAIAYGVRVSGCTVHFVDAGVDTGPVIAQACVPVRDDDTADSLHARIRVEEHRLLPEVTRQLAAGELRIEGRRVLRGGGAISRATRTAS